MSKLKRLAQLTSFVLMAFMLFMPLAVEASESYQQVAVEDGSEEGESASRGSKGIRPIRRNIHMSESYHPVTESTEVANPTSRDFRPVSPIKKEGPDLRVFYHYSRDCSTIYIKLANWSNEAVTIDTEDWFPLVSLMSIHEHENVNFPVPVYVVEETLTLRPYYYEVVYTSHVAEILISPGGLTQYGINFLEVDPENKIDESDESNNLIELLPCEPKEEPEHDHDPDSDHAVGPG